MELSSFGNDLAAGAPEPGIQREFGATENLPCALHGLFQNSAVYIKTLCVTPATQAGIADHIWSLQEVLKADA